MSITAMRKALDDICGAKLCEINSMSSRHEMIRLMDKAITALRTAISETEACVPCGYVDGDMEFHDAVGYCVMPGTQLYIAPQPAQPAKSKWNVLMVTTAYEQGVGKGIQAKQRDSEINNPYIESDCREAWAYGYQEGKDKAQPAKPLTRQQLKAVISAVPNPDDDNIGKWVVAVCRAVEAHHGIKEQA